MFTKLLTLVLLLFALPSLAAPWKSEAGLFSEQLESRFHQRHKDIRNAYDLEQLLKDVGRRFPSLMLEAEYVNGTWILRGTKAALIAEIELDIPTRFLRTPLQALVQGYIGEVDSPEVRGKISTTIKDYLRRRGFPLADVNLSIENTDEGANLQFGVTQGDPCLIEKIEFGFSVTADMEFDVETGDICDEEDIEAAIVQLESDFREVGYNQLKIELADVAINPATNYATVYVAGVLGQRVKYLINDNSQRFIIGDLFQDDELTNIDPSIVGPEAMASELVRRYQSRGYLDVKINGPEVKKTAKDEFIYTFNVDPNTQYILSSVEFEGVTQFTDEELLEIMGLAGLWNSSRPLNMEEIDSGLEALRVSYQEKGFWDAQVRDPGGGQRNKSTGTVRIVVNVKEGLPRILDNVRIEGNKFVNDETIRDLLDTENNAPIDRAKLVGFERDIRAIYVNSGFLYSEVLIELNATEEKRGIPTEIVVRVTEGPRVKIGDVAIVGLVKTEPKVVRRELLFATGDWYDPEVINESRRSLTRLGIFSSVRIVPADRMAVTEKSDEISLLVEVREGKPGNVAFGPGWNLVGGWLYSSETSYTNLGGVGRRLSLKGSISEEKHQPAIGPRTLLGRSASAGYLEPYIFGSPINSGISVRHRAEAFNEYWKLSNEGEINFSYKLRSFLAGSTVTTFYGQEISRIEGTLNSEENLATPNLIRVGKVGLRYAIDETNSKEFPTDGFIFNMEYAHAAYPLGGNLRFERIDFINSHFFGITDRWVFAVGLGLTSYSNIATESVDLPDVLPSSERLQLGGTTAAVRGYRPLRIGPAARVPTLEDGEWDCGHKFVDIGGSRRTVLKTELRYKITDFVATTGFIDSGTTFFSDEQVNELEKAFSDVEVGSETSGCPGERTNRRLLENVGYEYEELIRNPGYFWSRHYLSYGSAVNFLTPIGSLNLAYGLPWKQPETANCQDEGLCYDHGLNKERHWILRGNLHISLGAQF